MQTAANAHEHPSIRPTPTPIRHSRDWHARHRLLAVLLATSSKTSRGAGTHGYERAGDRRRQDQSSVYGLAKGKRAASGQMRLSERHRKESASEAWVPRAALRILALVALLLGLTLAAAPSADASPVTFIKAYGWGVLDGASQFETCTTTCTAGIPGGGAGQLDGTWGVATNSSGDVYVADIGNDRIDEFSAAGAFIKAYGWGVSDGASQFETCTSTCRAGLAGGGAGQLNSPYGLAIDSSGDVYVADLDNSRIDEFSAAGAFIKAYGWGVLDGASQFETCTATCTAGISGGGAGELYDPEGVAIDSSGDVYVADSGTGRIDEFSAAGAFIKAYGWGVSDGASSFETCTTTCRAGLAGGGAGQLFAPDGVATDRSGDVYVAEYYNYRIDEFSAAGAFIKAYGWGVSDGASQFETCTTTCEAGIRGGGAGQLRNPGGVAIDPSGDVYVADIDNYRIDEFSAAGAFIKAYGWGVLDGMNQFETCTSTCQTGDGAGDGAGELFAAYGVATDHSGDVYVADSGNVRIDKFSAAGAVSPAPATPRPCASRQLVISLGTLSAALGHLALPIRFRDRGGTCSLRGFPRVDGLSASGRVIIRAKRALKGYFGRWRIATITLKNGQTASALLEGLDPAFFSRRPRSSRNLRITPPNASHSVWRRTSYPLCYLTIHPVVARRNGGGA